MAAPLDMHALMQEELQRHKAGHKGESTAQSKHEDDGNTSRQHQEKHEYASTSTSTSKQIVEHPRFQLPPRGYTQARGCSEAIWERFRITHFPVNEEQHAEFSGQKLPGSLAYISEFITSEEESQLTECIHSSSYRDKWVHLKHRRLQNWGGHPTASGLQEKEQLPQWLESVIDTLLEIQLFEPEHRPNHVLINQYLPGEGILPHTDGPIYHPVVAILSLGAPALFRFRLNRDTQISEVCPLSSFSIMVEPRSLIIFSQELYSCYLHGIDDVLEETIDKSSIIPENAGFQVGDTLARELRESATIRHVPLPRATGDST